MLAQSNRFRGRGGVRFTMRKGQSVSAPNMRLIYFWRANNTHPPRVAIVVSKKVSKSAPRRNRLRRRIYAHMQPLLDSLPVGLDMVVIVKPPKGGAELRLDVAKEINSLLAKARLNQH